METAAPLNFVAPPLTVREASANLWTSPEPNDVVNNLQELREAILLDSLDAYDPSDVFLAIQGASLRFPPLPKKEQQNLDSENKGEAEKDAWSILRESIRAVAALAKVCVGPAWWYQSYQRRCFRARSGASRHHLPNRRPAPSSSGRDDSSSNIASTMSVHSSTGTAIELDLHHPSRANNSNNNNNPSSHILQSSQQPQRQSHSPNNATPVSNKNDLSPSWYPSIPELLPAAMLRLTANAVEKATFFRNPTMEQMHLIEAQLVVLQQLCCPHHCAGIDYDRQMLGEWNIPGAHEAAGTILAYSLKLLCTGRPLLPNVDLRAFVSTDNKEGEQVNNEGVTTAIKAYLAELPSCEKENWKNILFVTRATTDLLSAGWRPLPRENMAEDVILSLLIMACRGVKLDDLFYSQETTSKDAREERLVASSCAAEAISAHVSLATKGLVPLSLQNSLVRMACRLHDILSATQLSGASFDFQANDSIATRNVAEDENEIELQMEFFFTQRDLCLTGTWDLLWALLKNEASVEVAMEVSFSIIQATEQTLGEKQGTSGSPLINKLKWNDQTDDYVLMDCASIIRILSSALWGAAPDFSEIPLLRIFWHDTIQAIHQLLSTIYNKFATILPGTKSDNTKKSAPSSLLQSSYFVKQVRPLVVDCIVAFRRAIDTEVRGGQGVLSAVEWDAVVHGVEHSILPWLIAPAQHDMGGSFKKNSSVLASDEIRLEIESFLMRIGELLENCVSFDNAPLMDWACLRQLHILLLRDASPLLERGKAKTLGLSVVRSWVRFGFFPFRLEGWSGTASELLFLAFAIKPDGRYLHSPAIRLAALEYLTSDEAETDSSEEDTNVFPYRTLLSMTENIRELHLDILSNCIIPILQLILLRTTTPKVLLHIASKEPIPSGNRKNNGAVEDSDQERVDYPASEKNADPSPFDESGKSEGRETVPSPLVPIAESSEEATELKLYAVKLVGRLFLSVTIEKKLRSVFITTLQHTASRSSRRNEKTEPPLISIKLEALRQLDFCLTECFSDLPCVHECLLEVVQAICAVLKSALATMRHHDATQFEKASVLAIAATKVLGRLQLHTNHTLAIVPYSSVKSLNSSAPHNSQEESHFPREGKIESYLGGNSLKIAIASFVKVCEKKEGNTSQPDRMLFSFGPVAEDIYEILAKTAKPTVFGAKRTQLALYSLLRKSSFETLSNFLLSGVQLSLPNKTEDIFTTSADEKEASECSDEMFAMIKALSNFLQLSLASKVHRMKAPVEQKCFERPEAIGFGLFVSACRSRDRELVISTCQSLCALVPSLEVIGGGSVAEDTYRIIQERLNAEVSTFEAFGGTPPETLVRISTGLLAVLYEASWNWEQPTERAQRLKTFQICLDIVSNALRLSKSLSLHIALRCLLLVVGKFTSEDAEEARTRFQPFYEEHTRLFQSGFDCDSEEDPFAPMVINEALMQQCQDQNHVFDEMETSDAKSPSPLSKHDAMTTESENIDRFVVETDTSRYKKPCAAWLCDHNAVVTCRIGSSTSRFRGYIEVVIRSSIARVRRLVPMPSKLTLDDPECPSRLLFSPPSRLSNPKKPATSTSGLGDFAFKRDSSNILNHAQSLLDRFDSMFPQGDPDLLPPVQADTDDESSYRSQAPRDDDIHSVAASEGGTLETETMGDSATFAFPDSINYAPSSSSLSASQSHQDTATEQHEESIVGWFISVFGLGLGSIEDLKRYLSLHDMNISNSDTEYSQLKNYKFREGQPLHYSPKLERALSVLDRTTPLNTFKFALLYSGHRTESSSEEAGAEMQLLSTIHCSPAFYKFANQLGSMTPTRHLKYFSAGLDVSEYESDGKYTMAWSPPESTSTVVFHVVNLMPEGVNNRKRHVGNDNVLIVFVDKNSDIDLEVDSDGEFTRGSSIVSGHFNFATILVTVLPEPGLFRVTCRIRRSGISPKLAQLLSDFAGEDLLPHDYVANYVRGLAMRVDLACRTLIDGLSPPTNSLDRCRQIEEMKRFASCSLV